MDAISICAANYLPFVEILGKSFLDNHPEGKFFILVVDAERVEFDKNSKFNYIQPSDLDIHSQVFKNMSFYYNVTELSTALKPSALKWMIKNGSKTVAYLDPDIKIYGPLDELIEALNTSDIVLTPHTLSPIPRDGLRPSEAEIMGSGTFNLGFIAVKDSDEVTKFLNWWEERLRFDSIVDPAEMLFTDQRWIDLVPSYFNFKVLDLPNYNVAYWNLYERDLSTEESGEVLVNGLTLKFFHFSGYDPMKPWILCKYVANNPRTVISENSTLKKLCDDYGQELLSSSKNVTAIVEYGFDFFPSGKKIPTGLRRLYREDCIAADKEGKIQDFPEDWRAWANSYSPEFGKLGRSLYSVWQTRKDLVARFPDVTGRDFKDFLQWAKSHGVREGVVDPEIMNLGNQSSKKSNRKYVKNKGINVAGYLSAELGLGQSSRLILNSAISTQFPVTTIVNTRTTSRKNESFKNLENGKTYPFTISVVNADQFEIWVQDVGTDLIEKTTVVGVWAWETEDFPSVFLPSFDLVDEIWVVSEYVKQAIKKFTFKKVLVFPTPIIAPEITESFTKTKFGIPENIPYNLFIFDYFSVPKRKNPLGAIEAHKRAFPNQDGPIFVIKTVNGDSRPLDRELIRYTIQDRKDIVLIEDYLSRSQLHALVADCDVYVSLHRSEGYGLTIAEAMSLGKPVVATGYSGNMDFMNIENSIPVPFEKVSVGEDAYPYLPNSKWAEPDIEFASKELRRLFSDKDLRSRIGSKAKNHVEVNFTELMATKFIEQRVTWNLSLIGRVDTWSRRNLDKGYYRLRRVVKKLLGNFRK